MKRFIHSLFLLLFFSPLMAQTSSNMQLLYQYDDNTLPVRSGLVYNDCWGYVDGIGREYAIMGSLEKVFFFNVTDPNNVSLITSIKPRYNSSSIWRDFKTYGNYAYASADEGQEGLLIFNLSNLPNSVTMTRDSITFQRAHNIYIDEKNGKLYVAGSNTRNNGLIVYDLTANPGNPTVCASVNLHTVSPNGYVHDVHVVDNIAYCNHIYNNQGLRVYDFTNCTNPVQLGSLSGYPTAGLNHSGWLSPDKTHYVMADETHGSPLKYVNVADLSNMQITDYFNSSLIGGNPSPGSIVHNPFILGNKIICAYYHDGVQVFDRSNPNDVVKIAWYDTYTNTTYSGYYGAWGVYPYLPSGRVIASDILNGLHVLSLHPPFIKADQFGYLPNGRKVAVVSDPQTGYNALETFAPSTGSNQYQVRRATDDAVMFSGTLTAWNSGATHTQSGDKGWYFDFTSFNTPGSYYIYDVGKDHKSYKFDIGENVYDQALRQAIRTYFYQRINFAKQPPYADTKWADGACHGGPNQDYAARSRWDKTNPATARNVSGGWMDAGDYNKYTTFAQSAVIQLAEAYRTNPQIFKDDYNIPESGNGTPDILDELKYELDFLKRMQDATGTNGFFLKVGADNYNDVTPPSADTRPRYYLPECTSATLAGAAMFAAAGQALRLHSTTQVYGNDLITRAVAAWNRAKVTTSNFTVFETACDDGDIKAGDADNTDQEQKESAFVAAAYLYEATGTTEFKTYVESNYTNVRPYSINWWGPYWMPVQTALLRYAALPEASATVANNIRTQKANMNYMASKTDYNAATDLYRAHKPDAQFHWGSNQVHANCANMNADFVKFQVNTADGNLYREIARQYIHWMHGVNPMNVVMMSNMNSYGAENSLNEIYHTWFGNNSIWDDVEEDPRGPAPGYITGGPNKDYTGATPNITNQPIQKRYKEWNSGSPQNSWEITEPAIYYEAAYIAALSNTKGVSLSLKVFLEGAYNTGTNRMSDQLRSAGLLPASEPYAALGFTHLNGGGNEAVPAATLSRTGDNAIVDWIFVELRDKNNPATVLCTVSALLQRDGDVVASDGVSPLNFAQIIPDNYYIAVRHRNHFGFRTANAVALSAITTTLDFTNNSVSLYALAGASALKNTDGVWMMYAGDANRDGVVNVTDRNLFWRTQNGQPFNYSTSTADFNLDGAVNDTDKNALWKNNNSRLQSLD
jgi:choice-of-anchor B domain-containing protein